jgi:hypothetical protein
MEIDDSIQRARLVLETAVGRINGFGRAGVAEVLPRLFEMILPDLMDSHQVSPIHHPAHVADVLSRILIGEGAPEFDWLPALAAALLHDCAYGRVTLPGQKKISKSSIQKATGEERERAIERGIGQRLDHMQLGAEIAAEVLKTFNGRFGATFSEACIDEACRLIQIHDYPSIQEYESLRQSSSGRVWLFKPDDRLIKFFREADRLWMLTRDGIDEDLERAALGTTDSNRRDRLNQNRKRHREEMLQYVEAFGPGAEGAYGFLGQTLYRTTTGFSLFQEAETMLWPPYIPPAG